MQSLIWQSYLNYQCRIFRGRIKALQLRHKYDYHGIMGIALRGLRRRRGTHCDGAMGALLCDPGYFTDMTKTIWMEDPVDTQKLQVGVFKLWTDVTNIMLYALHNVGL